ncbi:MAG: agmatinase [Nitrososphaerota archaeon]
MSFREFFISTEPTMTNLNGNIKPIVSVFGVPYDATTSYRPGCRFGPNALRDAFWKIEVYDRALDVDGEKLPIEDLGNLHPMPEPEQMVDAVSKVTKELLNDGKRPAIIGGEHTLTYGSFSSMPKDSKLIVFDAHFDMRDELYGRKLSHGTFLRRLSEKMNAERFIHVGGRAASKEEWFLVDKIKHITSTELLEGKQFDRLIADDDNLYVSVDMDILDPAFAPGVGTPEPGGISSDMLLRMLRKLRGKRIVGFDIVELDPSYDASGITAIAAASVFSTLCSVASLHEL